MCWAQAWRVTHGWAPECFCETCQLRWSAAGTRPLRTSQGGVIGYGQLSIQIRLGSRLLVVGSLLLGP